MFEQTFVPTQTHARRPWTLAASLTLQTGLVAVAIILPMLHPELLQPKFEIPIYLPVRPKPPVVREKVAAVSGTARRTPVTLYVTSVPKGAPVLRREVGMADDAPDITGVAFSPGLAGSYSVIPGQGTLPPEPAPTKPEPVRAKAEAPRGPVHVSTGVQSALLVFGPKPVYPPLARAARVQGVVRLQAVISTDGEIRNLQLIGGPPLLVNAALEAVKQWRYRPTTLNGSAVEVITEIDVNFTLSQ